MFNITNLKDLQYLKYLNTIRPIIFLLLIIIGVWLLTGKPKKIKTSMEIELYQRDSLLQDSLAKINSTKPCQ